LSFESDDDIVNVHQQERQL